MARQAKHVQVLELVEKKGDEKVSNVVGPVEEELILEFLVDFLNYLASLL